MSKILRITIIILTLQLQMACCANGIISKTAACFYTEKDSGLGLESLLLLKPGVANQGTSNPVVDPLLRFTNGQAASVVIGQPDFTSNTGNNSGIGAKTVGSWIYGNPAYAGGRLYLPDYGNNRVLGFNAIPSVNFAPADFVLGQPDFFSNALATSAAGMSLAQTVSSNGTQFFVTDYGNSRITIFNSFPATTGAAADLVVGQTDLNLLATACSQTGLNYPESSFVAGNKLIIADSSSNRVLIYNSIPTTNGALADLVLGQANFTSCTKNRGGTVAANTLSYPTDVWSDGTRLFVADLDNNRVLVWNTFPTSNGQAADAVIGQPNFTSISINQGGAPNASTLYYPYFLTSNGLQLFVADTSNHRVLIWNTLPNTTGVAADQVLGQPDFVSNAAALSQTGLNLPDGVLAVDNQLIVADLSNRRYLIYNSQ